LLTSPPAVLLGVQQPQIHCLPDDVHSLVVAEEAIELVESYRIRLDESQKITLRTGMGTRVDGSWAASQMGDAESRQNGKGDVLQHREVSGLFLLHEHIIHTAHEFPTANKAFLRLVAFLEAWDDLRRKVKRIRYANGEQGVELLSGAAISYRARTGGGGRGWDNIGTVIYDEAQHLQAEHLAASSPAMAVHPNPQAWFAGSAGLSTSLVWGGIRRRALEGGGGRFGYVEHTAEDVSLDGGRLVSRSPEVWDREAWAKANPAYNVRISDEFLESQLRMMGPALFAREHLCVWDPLPIDEESRPPKLPADKWAATGSTVKIADPIRPTIAIDASPNGEWATVALGDGTITNPYVEVVKHNQGLGWVPEYIVGLIQRRNPLAVGIDGGGPAGALVGPVMKALADAGISTDLVHQMSTVEMKQACSGFYNDVVEGRLRRPAEGQGPLDVAAGDAAARVVGDAWLWDRRSATVAISPLVAVTIARALLPTEPAVMAYAGTFTDLDDF
jgi:hypothetical protein